MIKWSSRGEDVILQNCHVIGYEETKISEKHRVDVILEDGRRFSGDVLIGADGIWSKVSSPRFSFRERKCENWSRFALSCSALQRLPTQNTHATQVRPKTPPPGYRRVMRPTPFLQGLRISCQQILTQLATECFSEMGSTSSRATSAAARCNGMASTKSLKVTPSSVHHQSH